MGQPADQIHRAKQSEFQPAKKLLQPTDALLSTVLWWKVLDSILKIVSPHKRADRQGATRQRPTVHPLTTGRHGTTPGSVQPSGARVCVSPTSWRSPTQKTQGAGSQQQQREGVGFEQFAAFVCIAGVFPVIEFLSPCISSAGEGWRHCWPPRSVLSCARAAQAWTRHALITLGGQAGRAYEACRLPASNSTSYPSTVSLSLCRMVLFASVIARGEEMRGFKILEWLDALICQMSLSNLSTSILALVFLVLNLLSKHPIKRWISLENWVCEIAIIYFWHY